MAEESGLKVPQCNENKSDVFKWCYFPELIQIEIFKNLDVKRLLLYRTICPAWNKTICEVLRHKVSVQLRAIFSYKRESQFMSKKLHPFVQNYYGKTAQFNTFAIQAEGECKSKMKAQKIRKFLKDQSQKKEKISIYSDIAQSNLFNLFYETGAITNNPALTHLNLNVMNHWPTISLNDQPINLPALTHLNVTIQIELVTRNGIITQVINGAPNLTNLTLLWYGFNKKLIARLNFKNIKVLKLWGPTFYHDECVFPQLIQKVSETIEELHTDAENFEKLEPAGIPKLPKLNTLHIFISWCSQRDFNRFQTWIRQDNLPMLKNIGLDPVNHIEQDQLIPHDGVEALKLCFNPNYLDCHFKNYLPRSLTLFRNVRTKFPTVNSIDFTWIGDALMPYDALDQVIANLVEVFPGLESFTLRTSYLTSTLFTGLESERFLRLYPRANLEKIPRKTCIRDFPRLKKFVLRDMDNSLNSEIMRSIAELPSLEIFEFNWNSGLSVDDVVSHLGNLKMVSIGNCCKTQLSVPINDLFMRTGNVRCGCKNYKNNTGFFWDDYCENDMQAVNI